MQDLFLCRKCAHVNTKESLRNVSIKDNTKMCRDCKGKLFYKVSRGK